VNPSPITKKFLFLDDEIISNANAHRRSLKVHGHIATNTSSSSQQNSKVTGKNLMKIVGLMRQGPIQQIFLSFPAV
jgi:hypothetical protein